MTTTERQGPQRVPPDRSPQTVAGQRAGSRRGRRSAGERERTRTRPSRRRALRRRWVALLVLVTVLVLACLAWFTPVLGVKSVQVRGNSSLSAEQVRSAAAVPDRRPLLRVDTEEIQQRVLDLSGIATAEVSRSWPWTIEISVTERAAVAYFDSGVDLHLVDSTGFAFKTVRQKPAGLPQLTVPVVDPNEPRATAATAVLAAIPAQLRGRVRSVAAATPGSVELTLTDGKVVRWGAARDTDRKAAVLAALLSQQGKTYDVSSPELPTVS